MTRLDPYLNFDGDAAEAMSFYASVFGGKPEVIRFRDFPSAGDVPEDELDLAMHASLVLPNGDVLMASDVPARLGKVQPGTNTYVMIGVDTADEARRLYDGLSAGGSVQMALGDSGFAELYASFADRYGINWMIYFGGNRAMR